MFGSWKNSTFSLIILIFLLTLNQIPVAQAATPSQIERQVRQAAQERSAQQQLQASESGFVTGGIKPTPIKPATSKPAAPEVKVVWQSGFFKLWQLDGQWYFSVGTRYIAST